VKGRYEESGVNIRKGQEAVDRIRALCRSTFGPDVVGDFGGFAGAFRAPGAPGQVLLSSMDGVGTKLKVAILCDRHDTVGYDLVCHSANDILVHWGASLRSAWSSSYKGSPADAARSGVP